MNRKLILLYLLASFVLSYSLQAQDKKPLEGFDQYVGQAVEDFDLPGLAIAIIKDGKVVMSKAYGYKNTETGEKLNTSDLFNIASCSKAFTTACMAKLVEEGKIKWTDKVTDYVPNFQLADPYITREMNLADLLCHRSGLSTFTGDLLWFGTDYTQEEVVERMRNLPIENDFRSQYGYQNNMYTVAGLVIKAASGLTWEDYLQKHFFDPLDMKNATSCSNELTKSANLAMPHLKEKVQPIDDFDPHPALSLYVGVDEMTNWVKMLLNKGKFGEEQILSERSLWQMWSAHTVKSVSPWKRAHGINLSSYGLGWNLYDYGGKLIVEHDGGMPGYISKVCLVPEENLGIIILTNDMTILGAALRYRLLDKYLTGADHDWAKEFLGYKKQGDQGEIRAKEVRHAARQLDTKASLPNEDYTGTYNDRSYGDATITIEDGKLKLTMVPSKRYFTAPMNHWHHDTWQFDFPEEFLPEGFVTFSFDSNGKVEGFKIDLPNPDFHFYKLDFRKVE